MSNTLVYSGVSKKTLAIIAVTIGVLLVAMMGIRYAAAVAPSDYGLHEGDTVSAAGSDDPDVYIVNEQGYKRLFLNPVIFGFYGHLGGFAAVKSVTPATRDAFPTSGLFRNCETNDLKVYGVETTGEDTGNLHWVNTTGAQAVADDANFFKKVFCINTNEFNWYAKSATDYTSVGQVPVYTRAGLPPVVTGPLSVALAPDNPAAKTITLNASGAEFLKVRFSGTGTVSSMTIKRLGAGETNDFSNLYIYDGATRLTSGKSFSSATGEATFISLNIAVSGTKDISIVADMASTNTAGNVNYVQLNAVVLSSGTVSGLPISGNNFSSSGASSGTIDTAKVGSLGNPNVGAVQAQLSEFKLTANTEAASVKRLTLIQGGSVKPADIKNLKIKAGTQEWSGTMTTKGYAVFDLGSGFSIVKGGNAIFKVYGDLAGKATETVILYFENDSDLLAIGDQYGQGMAEGSNTLDTAAEAGTLTLQGGVLTINFVGPSASNIGTDTSDTVFLRYSMTAATNIEVRKTRFTWCWDNDGSGTYDAAADTANGFNDVLDVKVTDEATGAVVMGPHDGSAFTTSRSSTCPDSVTGASKQYTDVFDLTAGQTRSFKVTADVKTSNGTGATADLASTDKIKIYLEDYTADTPDVTVMKYPDTNTSVADADIVPSADVAGSEMTIQTSSLTLGLAATPGSQTYVVGTSNVDMVGITFAAAQASELKVNDIVLTGWAEDETNDTATKGTATTGASGGTDTAVSVANALSNIRLYEAESGNLIAGSDKISNNQLGVLGTGTIKFSFQSSPWTIPAGSTKTMLVRVDLSKNAASGSSGDNYSFDVAATGDITALDSSSNTVNASSGSITPNAGATQTKMLTVKNTGSVTISQAPNSPMKGAAYWGQTGVPFSKFRFTSTNEGQYIDKLTVTASVAAEATDAIANVKKVYVAYTTKDGRTLTANQSFSSGASANFGFTDADRPYVPKDSSLDITISADLRATSAEGATQDTGATPVYFSLDLTDTYNGSTSDAIKFSGEGSGAVLNGASTGIADVLGKNDMYVYRVFPKVDIVALSSPYVLIGTPDIFKFTITAMGLPTSKLLFDGGTANSTSGSIIFEVVASGELNTSGMTTTSSSFTTYLDDGTILDTNTNLVGSDPDPAAPTASLNMDFSSQDLEIAGGTSRTLRVQFDNPTQNYAKTSTTGRAADYFQISLPDSYYDSSVSMGVINWVGNSTGSTNDVDSTSIVGYIRNLPLTGPVFQR